MSVTLMGMNSLKRWEEAAWANDDYKKVIIWFGLHKSGYFNNQTYFNQDERSKVSWLGMLNFIRRLEDDKVLAYLNAILRQENQERWDLVDLSEWKAEPRPDSTLRPCYIQIWSSSSPDLKRLGMEEYYHIGPFESKKQAIGWIETVQKDLQTLSLEHEVLYFEPSTLFEFKVKQWLSKCFPSEESSVPTSTETKERSRSTSV